MRATMDIIKRYSWFLVICSGFMAILIALLVTPSFAVNYLSQDHHLTPDGEKQLNLYRLALALAGMIFLIARPISMAVQSSETRVRPLYDRLSRLFGSKYMKGLLIILIVGFSLLRFVNISADFPLDITQSSELYTDEGWYSAAAVRHMITGHWYQAGEVNTAVAAPVGHILQRISLALLGLSLSSARTTVAVSFLLVIIFTALLVRRSFGNSAAILAALLLATNYLGFAYSRLATPYLMATALSVAGLFVAEGVERGNSILRILAASLLVGAGILTHATAVVAVPLLVFLAWRGGAGFRQRILNVITAVSAIVVIVAGNRVITNWLFPEDYILYNSTTVGLAYKILHDWWWSLVHKMPDRLLVVGSGLVIVTILLATTAAAVSKRFRNHALVHLLVIYIVINLGLLSMRAYSAPRYFSPLLVPFSGLCAISCVVLVEQWQRAKLSAVAILPLLCVLGIALQGTTRIFAYLSEPQFSFYEMAHGVGDILQKREGSAEGVMLFGDIAASVSLEIGTSTADSLLIAGDLRTKLEKDRPSYIIVHVSNLVELAREQGATVTELGAWDVMENYYANGERVRLYAVKWPVESGP